MKPKPTFLEWFIDPRTGAVLLFAGICFGQCPVVREWINPQGPVAPEDQP